MHNKELIFAVGPVEMDKNILDLGSNQPPYFRTDDFSRLILENESILKKLLYADEKSKVLFLTASGTGAMDATISNLFNEKDKVLIINGGSFGNRFKEICDFYNINNEQIKLNQGQKLLKNHLEGYKNKGFTSLLVNVHETSTGVLYDMPIITEFCEQNNLLLVVDAISSFLADEYTMSKWNIDVTILSSQKALALPPGISMVALSERALEKLETCTSKSYYFNFKDYIKNGERGQTPYTPAVSILIQLNQKLKDIETLGVSHYIDNCKILAEHFRKGIKNLPFEIPSESLSNAVTPLKPLGKMKAHDIFEYIKENYNIYLCPNGGEFRDTLFRVGHIGNLSIKDNEKLLKIFNDMYKGDLI